MKNLDAILLGAVALALTVASCGGGTDGTGAVPPPTSNVTSTGVMTKGSVILNGTHFDPAAATIVDDRGRGAAQLDSGMVIKLRGRSDDGVTGLADRIDVENEARGAIQSIEATADPRRFTVSGLVALVDDRTRFANLAGFTALAVGKRVEVHGLRDSAGLLHATRVEAVGAQDGPDALRGAVSNLTTSAHQFTLNGTLIDYAGAAFAPAGASEAALANGKLVELGGTLNGSVFRATQVEIEDLADAVFRGAAGEKQAVEGFISGFSASPGVFQVDGHTVQTVPATVFEGGTADDLANDVGVEIDGVLDSQLMLVATKVEFTRTRIILQGLAIAVDAVRRTLTLLTQTAHANDLTRIDALGIGGHTGSLADVIANLDCVDVRGHMEGAVFVAERITELSRCGADVIQANVSGKNEVTGVLTFFGGLVAILPVTAEYRDANDVPVNRAAFLALVNAAGGNSQGTLVKLSGTSVASAFTAAKAEIKN